MAWSDAIVGVTKAFSQVFEYLFGTQSRAERQLEAEADALEAKWRASRDPMALDELNDVRSRLKRLRDKAAARRLR